MQSLLFEIDGEPEPQASTYLEVSAEGSGRRKRKKLTKSVHTASFDLAQVASSLEAFVAGSEDRLELQPFTSTRRKRVKRIFS